MSGNEAMARPAGDLDLMAALAGALGSEVRVRSVSREHNIYASTFASEIVTCHCEDGRVWRLLCKRGAGQELAVHGHKAGAAYEAQVYREVLCSLGMLVPGYAGSWLNPGTGETWLFLAWLDDAERLNLAGDPQAPVLAARWIGRFHAAAETFAREAPSFLTRYDEAYYRGWAERTLEYAAGLRDVYPWLEPLCAHLNAWLCQLLGAAPTIVHGEYYPENVLLRGNMVYPVDWESASVAAGEVDLASLTDGWPADIAQGCIAEYRRARWPEGVPAGAARTLEAARVYLQLRWLGERPEWTSSPAERWRFMALKAAFERLQDESA